MISRRFFGYVLSGGSAAVVDLGVFLALVSRDVSIPVAALVSFGFAAVWNYAISSRFVFRQRLSGRAFILFLGVAVMGAAINGGVTWFAAAQGAAPALAKLIGIGIAFFANYAANSLIVFRQARDSESLCVDREYGR